MTEIRADISISTEKSGNLLQRLNQLRDEIETIEAHQEKLAEMGYTLKLGSTESGELMVEIKDKTTS
jgi:hypothetical protein